MEKRAAVVVTTVAILLEEYERNSHSFGIYSMMIVTPIVVKSLFCLW
jgi:hypothetical protein